MLAGIALLIMLPGRWSDMVETLFPPPTPTAIPSAAADRAQLVSKLAPPSASPAADALFMLWRLIGDENHFVRGQALEALARGGEGARMDPRRMDRIREIAAEDTDWNRRSACVMLLKREASSALPACAMLWARTKNANTKSTLIDALWAADATTALGAASRAKEPAELAPFAREALDLFRARAAASPSPAR